MSPRPTREERLAEKLVPLAAELVGTVRDHGPDAVAEVLARVPDGRHDALAVVLAAMVNPDATPSQLLGWTEWQGSHRAVAEHRRLLAAGVPTTAADVLAGGRRRARREHSTDPRRRAA